MGNKLKGYTILEILMAMIISSIVIVSAWSGIEKVSFLYQSFRKKNEMINEVTLLNRILMLDFSKSTYVLSGDNSMNCIYADKMIEYIFTDNFIIRRSSLSDTFFIPSTNLSFNYIKGDEGDATQFVNELNFDRSDKKEQYTLHYFKNYGADALVNIKKTANGN